MAGRTARTRKQTDGLRKAVKKLDAKQRAFVAGTAILLTIVLGIMMVAVPGFSETLFDVLGIRVSDAKVAAQIEGPTKVHIINVLQGDAVLLEQGGQFALMDAGPPEGTDNLLAYMDGVGVKELQYIIMTHPHADHIGGMHAVLQRYAVKQMIFPDFEKAPYPTTSTFKKIVQTLLEKNIPTETAMRGKTYRLGNGVITVLQDGLPTTDNYNLLSLGLLFEVDGFGFFNFGDAEKQNERALLESGLDVRADVLLAGHHGSSTSNTPEFMAAVRPQLVIVSLAADNSYGHPHREAMAAFEEQKATVLRTDQDGTVVVGPGQGGGIVYAVSNPQ